MRRLACIALMILVPAARAQVTLPNVRLPGLPQVPLTSPLETDGTADLRMLREVRRKTIRDLIRRNRSVIQADRNGAPIVRGEIVAVSPGQDVVEAATAAGFTVLRTRMLEGLEAEIVVFGVPAGMDTLLALARLRALAPEASFDLNHIYMSSGSFRSAGVSDADGAAPAASAAPGVGAGSAVAGGATAALFVLARQDVQAATATARVATDTVNGANPVSAVKVGLIDSGVDAAHPVFAGLSIHQHGCTAARAPGAQGAPGAPGSPVSPDAPYAPVPDAHGTAVASLLVGRGFGSDGPAAASNINSFSHASKRTLNAAKPPESFHSSAPGGELFAADVYCGKPTGGAADAVAEAFAWLSHERVPVINVSLVGPANVMLEAVIRLVIARGHLVVAAVGNDGPAAAPLYPASYPGVVGVTAVDSHRRVLFEAGRGPQVRFAAPGADIAAARSVETFETVRGTSFAAPLVAGLLAARLPEPDLAGAQRAVEELSREAVDLGAAGVDPVYGYGLVGADLFNRKP